MSRLSGLKPERVIRAFIRAGWKEAGHTGSHVKLVKKDNINILSIPVHKKSIGIGLIRDQIAKSGLTVDEFLEFYR
ncbi:MAG: type II toxin-antitoxin system HicA family toxin [Candidatus Eremiobacterota bacterium]